MTRAAPSPPSAASGTNNTSERKSQPELLSHRQEFSSHEFSSNSLTTSVNNQTCTKTSAHQPAGQPSHDSQDRNTARYKNKTSPVNEGKKKSNTEPPLKSDEEFEEELQRAIQESAKMQSTLGMHSSGGVIDLSESFDESTTELPALKSESPSLNNESNEDDQLAEAIRLSIESANANTEDVPQVCRTLGRQEFAEVVHEFVNAHGGYETIEKCKIFKEGNSNSMKKANAAGGGQHQSGAQYGTLSISAMYRIYDVLEGRSDIRLDEPEAEMKHISVSEMKQLEESSLRLESPARAKIRAFVDIGHGMGILVLQAGWSLGVPSRGVELLKDRHDIATKVRDGVLDTLRNDPPDSTMVELQLADFSRAMIPDKHSLKCDNNLRSFLLFRDMPLDTQQGLVIFVNNAFEVFGARSGQTRDSKCLDFYIAQLFANMEVGGRIITLTDVSPYLTNQSGWFRRDIFLSGLGGLTWANWKKSSVCVYVLTKTSDEWNCTNCYKASAVVTVDGELSNRCVWCNKSLPIISTRSRGERKRPKYT